MSKATPLVGIIMGSQSDWPTMKPRRRRAGRARRRLRGQASSPPTARRTGSTTTPRPPRRGAQGHHRRRRRCRAPAGHDGIHDPAAGAGRARRSRRRFPARTACCRSCRCRPACRSARWPSARPAPPTRVCWPPQILALDRQKLSPSGCRGRRASRPRRFAEAPKDDA